MILVWDHTFRKSPPSLYILGDRSWEVQLIIIILIIITIIIIIIILLLLLLLLLLSVTITDVMG